mgnify:FL=1
MPENVSEIGDMAFINCTSLRTVTIDAETPPTLKENYKQFQGCTQIPYVIVTRGDKETYKNSKWGEISDIKIAQNHVLTVIGGDR